MHRLPVTAFACLALVAGSTAVVGCGSSDDKKSASTPATTSTATSPQATAAPPGGVVKVSMKNIKFVPHDITVKVGQKILWTNHDGQIPHTVTATKGAIFDSGNIDGGGTFDYTSTKAGTIDYVCTIHSGQSGTITVTK